MSCEGGRAGVPLEEDLRRAGVLPEAPRPREREPPPRPLAASGAAGSRSGERERAGDEGMEGGAESRLEALEERGARGGVKTGEAEAGAGDEDAEGEAEEGMRPKYTASRWLAGGEGSEDWGVGGRRGWRLSGEEKGGGGRAASRLSGEENRGGVGATEGIDPGMGTRRTCWAGRAEEAGGGVGAASAGGAEGAGVSGWVAPVGGESTKVLQRASVPGRWVVARQNIPTWRGWPHR
jgi:hypothetical protein